MEDQCDFPYCRNMASMQYCGKQLCDKHWATLADADGEEEAKLLSKIGLCRGTDGVVTKERNTQ